jgi:hypothetical protein
MVEVYGRWPGVVAIVGDEEMYCVPCAKGRYGEEAVQAVVDGMPGYERYTDHEGNTLEVVLRGSEDLHTASCRDCGARLCEEDCPCYRHPETWQHYGRLVWDEEPTENYPL